MTQCKVLKVQGLFLYIVVFCAFNHFSIAATLPGDISGDGTVGLEDAMTALRVASGYQDTIEFPAGSDIGRDSVINLQEAIYSLQNVQIATDKADFFLRSLQSTGTTLVTMGIPFSPGALLSTDNVRIFDNLGNEAAIFVKPTLQWHFKQSPENTIRAVKIQFYANMQTGEELTYKWDITTPRNKATDIQEQANADSLFTSPTPGKGGVDLPRIITIHNPHYLAKSELIPPFATEAEDNHKSYLTAQFNWAKDLNLETSTIANWLFDRPTSIYKICMRNGDADCYVEAFQSYNYWQNGLIMSGNPLFPDCTGGLQINGSSTTKACDTKYLYMEPIKIHTALTGIDTLFSDKVFLKKMADLIEEPYYQGMNTDAYDIDELFTERSAGLTLLAKISAYELLPEHAGTLLDNISQRISVLIAMQNSNPDQYAYDGTFRHSWDRHEGNIYPGNIANDRRFSPWMSENLIDALWHYYQIEDSSRIKEMLLGLARGTLKWGFAASKGYVDKFGDTLHNLPMGEGWTNGCSTALTNNYKPIVIYSGSSTADSESLITTQRGDGWYSDSHNPETVLTLSMGYHFAENATEKAEFEELIQAIHNSYFTQACGAGSSTKRKFNWNNRSNAWGTYLYFKELETQ